MPFYSQRQFVKVANIRKNGTVTQVLCFIWHNDAEDRWEIDYCDKVTKDTIRMCPIAAVNHNERAACLMMLDEAITNANR